VKAIAVTVGSEVLTPVKDMLVSGSSRLLYPVVSQVVPVDSEKPAEAIGGSKESKTGTVVILKLVLSAHYSTCFGLLVNI